VQNKPEPISMGVDMAAPVSLQPYQRLSLEGRARIDAQVDWLKDSGLITLEDLGGLVRIATITERGLDVVAGRATVTGVDRPTPKAR